MRCGQCVCVQPPRHTRADQISSERLPRDGGIDSGTALGEFWLASRAKMSPTSCFITKSKFSDDFWHLFFKMIGQLGVLWCQKSVFKHFVIFWEKIFISLLIYFYLWSGKEKIGYPIFIWVVKNCLTIINIDFFFLVRYTRYGNAKCANRSFCTLNPERLVRMWLAANVSKQLFTLKIPSQLAAV